MRKDLPPHSHGKIISTDDHNIIISGNKQKAKNCFDDCAWKMNRCHNYPTAYGIDMQVAMRLAFNGLLGNHHEVFDV